MTSHVYARTILAAAVLMAGCSAEKPHNQATNAAATSIEQAETATVTERSIAPELMALKTTANAIEPGQDIEGFVKAWEAVRDKAISLYGKGHIEVRMAQSEINFKHYYTGEFKKGLELLQPHIDYLETLDASYEYERILALEKLSTLQTNFGQVDEIAELDAKIHNYWLTSNRAEKNDRLVNSFNSLATTAHSLGKPVLALEHIEAALKIVSENDGFEQYEPYLIYNRANFLTSAGLNDEAFKASREGIRRMAELDQTNHVINGFLLTSLATQLHHHGRYEEAIETSKASVSVLQELYGPQSPRVYQVQTVLLGLLIKQGDYEKAISLADNLMPILEESDGKESRNYLFFLMGKRRAEFLQQPSAEKLSLYSGVIDRYEEILGENNRFALGARRNEIMMENLLGDIAVAREKAAKLEGRYRLMDSPNLGDVRVIEALSGLLAIKSGEASGLEKSYAAYREARDDFQDKLRLSDKTVSPSLNQKSVMEIAIEAALLGDDVDKAFEIGQIYTHGGARAALAKAKVRSQNLPKDQLRLIRQHQDDLESKAALIADRDKASRKANQTTVQDLSKTIDETDNRLSESTQKLSKTFPGWMEAEELRFASVKTIQARLKANEAILFPVVTDRGIAVFGITKSDVTAEFVTLEHTSLREWTVSIRRSLDASALTRLETGLQSKNSHARGFDIPSSQSIYNSILPAKIRSLLSNADLLYVSTNNVLSTLPLGMLATPEYRTDAPQYLSDEFAIINLPYLSAFKTSKETSKRSLGQYYGIGAPYSYKNTVQNLAMRSAEDSLTVESLSPLPNAERELKTIASLKSIKRSKLLLGKEATEKAVKDLLIGEGDIVVFATHGLLSGELMGVNEPALVLSANDGDDGILTAREISTLSFPADIVILSACNTGGQGGGSAEGLSGLASSFFYAGAQNLLVSHWPVRDDAAAFLTVNMIENTQSGMSKAEALQKAMQDLRSNTDIPNAAHPALWASFVLVSE